MTINKRKKNTRQRGGCTHGWGSMKKHRGAGHRCGRGMAGTGKRGDARKTQIWAGRYLGKHGFSSKSGIGRQAAINVWELDALADKIVERKLAQKEGEFYVVDIGALGCFKLLSSGNVSKKFKITADSASEKAIEKVKAAGGEVLLRSKDESAEEPAAGEAEEKAESTDE